VQKELESRVSVHAELGCRNFLNKTVSVLGSK
jgi:hypothetical protein